MSTEIPGENPLRTLFSWATRSAFRFNPQLYSEAIGEYFSEWILGRFIHIDNIQEIRNEDGSYLRKADEVLSEGFDKYDHSIALYQHVGDYVLFMVGIFPEGLLKHDPADNVLKLGPLFYPVKSAMDYYVYQGQASYKKASELTKAEEKAAILKQLAAEFTGYINVMGLIRLNLEACSCFKNRKGIIGPQSN